jgi:hypothetical protein
MKPEAKFKAGDYVQRVNQPELAGIVREPRWDGQVESWNYLVQFGAQLRAVPKESLEVVTVVQSPWESPVLEFSTRDCRQTSMSAS